MLAISLLWMSTVLWPTGITRTWTYLPALQASAFCAAVSAVFAIGLFRSVLRAFVFALIAVLAIVIVPRIPAPFIPDATADSVRVFALNTYFGAADDQAIAQRVAELKPDVVVLSETNPKEVEAVASKTNMVATGSVEPGAGGADAVAILIREGAPMNGAGDQGLTRFQNPMVTRPAKDEQSAPLDIMGVHFVAPVGDDRVAWDSELETTVNWVNDKKAAGNSQLILAGDFNATRLHPRFRDLQLEDCTGHMAHTPTWPAVLPLLRLDHILTTGTCHGAGQVGVEGTDHKGVWADISA